MDERTREAERLSQVEGDPAARERWEAEQERLGRLKRIDLPIGFLARVERPRWLVISEGEDSEASVREVLGPIGRPQRVSQDAIVTYECPQDAARRLELRGELRAVPTRGWHLVLESAAGLEMLADLSLERVEVTVRDLARLPRLSDLPGITGLTLEAGDAVLRGGALASVVRWLPLDLASTPPSKEMCVFARDDADGSKDILKKILTPTPDP